MHDLITGRSEEIGRRIARARKAAGLTQQGLAGEAHVSQSLIQQVETGRKPATPSLVAAVARALHVDPADLYGQPYRAGTPGKDRVHAAIPEIRWALACAAAPPDLDVPPRPLDVLAREVEDLLVLTQDARHVQVGARLPAVLAELTVHAHESGSPRAWRILNRAQALAVSLARRLGYSDLAYFGVEQAAVSAARSDDANLPRVAMLSKSLLLMTIGAWGPGLKLVRQASRGMEDAATARDRAVAGALQLRAAVLCARAGRQGEAWEHHGQAAEIARRLPGRVPDFYGLQFNPANVVIHGAAVAVELCDPDEAIRRDRGFRASPELSAERRAHHEIDMSRAFLLAGRHDAALARLARADRVAPQMSRYHPMARETVARLADHYRRVPERLRVLMHHMGVQ